MQNPLYEYYRCSEDVHLASNGSSSPEQGFFSFGDILCFGRCSGITPVSDPEDDVSKYPAIASEVDGGTLGFEPGEVLDNLRFEQYLGSEGRRKYLEANGMLAKAYYAVRPLLGVSVRRHFQKLRLRGWEKIPFPHWPVDTTVEALHEELLTLALRRRGNDPIPFIWFWPEGKSAAAIMTHDVETTSGRDFCDTLMDIDESFGIKAAYQVVPEQRYQVTENFLAAIRSRGHEINVHDLNHDGKLFQSHEQFLVRAKKIKHYLKEFKTEGFRSGAMYRNQLWHDALGCSYDMSVPNVAHLEGQRGGCCTVMPYFAGKVLELPVTMTQDYPLFQILRQYSLDLWRRQIHLVLQKHGLISFIVHPDYIIENRERRIYLELLEHLSSLRKGENIWFALPAEINEWWRQRSQMQLRRRGNDWQIEGPGSDRARISYAYLDEGKLQFTFDPPPHQEPAAIGARTKTFFPVPHAAIPNVSANGLTESKALNVCMVAYSFYESDNRVMRYAETLAARGDHVEVIALKQKNGPANSDLPYEVMNGVHVYRIQEREANERGKVEYFSRVMAFFLRSLFFLKRRNHVNTFDLVHVHSVPDFLVFTALFAKFAGAKIILDIHDVLPEFYGSKFKKSERSFVFRLLLKIEKLCASFADRVIISNDIWLKKYTGRTSAGEKCCAIMNFPDPAIFTRRGRNRTDNKFIMVYPGTLNWHQGLDIAVNAFARVAEKMAGAEFHIYGSGRSRESLIQLIQDLGLQDRVLIKDSLPLRQIAAVIENADLGIVPKRKDSFGNEAFSTKTLEFMTLGVPLIVSDTTIDTYYFNDSVVKFFHDESEDDLAACMLQMYEKPALRKQMAANALEFAKNFSWGVRKTGYLDLVDGVVQREHTPSLDAARSQAAAS